ncbi:hypothetical protein Tco_1577234 [Tanacetum coccineum]
MLAPKCPTFNGRPTFANPRYLKKAQNEIPCLYAIPHDQSDPANRLIPDREETQTLEEESRSKLNKDLVKPFDYTKLNIRMFVPLALKTQNDSFAFVHELKQEMHADLKYTWDSLLRPKDETPDVFKRLSHEILKIYLQAPVISVRAGQKGENLDMMKERGIMILVGIYLSQRICLSTTRNKASDYDNPDLAPELQNVSPSADTTIPSQQELDLLFGPLYDEFFNAGTSCVNKSSSPTDDSAKQDTLPSTNIHPTTEASTPTHVNAEENNNDQAEFTNPLCTPVQENAESSSRNIGNSNVPTFNQPQDSEYRWTKDHPLTQVRGNPSKPVQTR